MRSLLAHVLHRPLAELDRLHQSRAGEECYIFGNGISLKWMDLRQFADRPSILAHHMIYHREVGALDAPYCTVIEPNFFYPLFFYNEQGKFAVRRQHDNVEFRKAMREHPDTLFFVNLSNYPVARFANALFVSRVYTPPAATSNPFRDRPDAHAGTLKFQIALAIYLGFKKAYLVGHDYTHYPARWLHFFERGIGSLHDKRGFAQDFLDYAKRHIDLVTVTVDAGSVDCDFVTYEDLTGKKPHFRENTDLVDKEKLDTLATWGGYTIYG